MRISETPEHLEIRGCGAIRGLVVESEWPEESVVSGLRQLTWFAGGGLALDNKILEQLLRCTSLDKMTLAYASLSKDNLGQIGEMPQLSVLILPGADLDDEITKQWTGLQSLWEVNLDDTNVSLGTLAWLSSIGSLRSLSLNRVPLEDSIATEDALSGLGQLSELHLAGVPIRPVRLAGLLSFGNLEVLNLSDSKIGPPTVDVLCSAKGLKLLVLHNCDLDRSSLQRILQANPELFVDVGANPNKGLLNTKPQHHVLSGVDSLQDQRWKDLANQSTSGFRRELFAKLSKSVRDLITPPYDEGRIAHQRFRPPH